MNGILYALYLHQYLITSLIHKHKNMKVNYLSRIMLGLVLIFASGYSLSAKKPEKPTTLKEALKGKFYIGTALNTRHIGEKDTADVDVIKCNFNAIVAENCMKSMFLQPREGEFNFKERGIRIDAIGMQGHLGMDRPPIAEYEEAIRAYTHAGVNVMVTEFDLSILPSPRDGIGAEISTNIEYQKEFNPYTEGVPNDVMQAWTNRMLDLFKLFLKYPGKVTRVTMWGVTDGGSWKNNFPVRGRTDYPLLFDRNHQAKPVVEEIIKLASNATK